MEAELKCCITEISKNGYTFHHENSPSYNFFRMCNHFSLQLMSICQTIISCNIWQRSLQLVFPKFYFIFVYAFQKKGITILFCHILLAQVKASYIWGCIYKIN